MHHPCMRTRICTRARAVPYRGAVPCRGIAVVVPTARLDRRTLVSKLYFGDFRGMSTANAEG